MTLVPTSSQTVGPFYHIGLAHLATDRVGETRAGDATIAVHGRVFDGDGVPVPDYVLEVWQPSTHEQAGFGRVLPHEDGAFSFTTARGSTHLVALLFMRGLLKPLLTRMYFPDAPLSDDVLSLVPEERRKTLVARATNDGVEWNVMLQGTDETVFFEW